VFSASLDCRGHCRSLRCALDIMQLPAQGSMFGPCMRHDRISPAHARTKHPASTGACLCLPDTTTCALECRYCSSCQAIHITRVNYSPARVPDGTHTSMQNELVIQEMHVPDLGTRAHARHPMRSNRHHRSRTVSRCDAGEGKRACISITSRQFGSISCIRGIVRSCQHVPGSMCVSDSPVTGMSTRTQLLPLVLDI
jgi:hypothetical protein